MIEAAIVGRTVHSVLAEEFKDTQGGTLHFRYLLAENGGFLRVAATCPNTPGRSPRRLRHRTSGAKRAPGSCGPSCGRMESTCRRRPSSSRRSSDWRRRRARRARMPIWLYPVSVLLWLVGVVCSLPAATVESRRKQWRIAEKKTYNVRKRLRRIQPTRRSDRSESDVPRRKVG